MLASTVKFSTYGRKHGPPRMSRRIPGPLEVVARHETQRPKPQDPTACLGRPDATSGFHSDPRCFQRGPVVLTRRRRVGLVVNVPHSGACPIARRTLASEHLDSLREAAKRLLRKEVIQPHLPVRLPCYDLVLIASPTFDSSLHKGWATGFGCYRLS